MKKAQLKKKKIKETKDEYKELICKGQDKKGSEQKTVLESPLPSSPPCLGEQWEHSYYEIKFFCIFNYFFLIYTQN